MRDLMARMGHDSMKTYQGYKVVARRSSKGAMLRSGPLLVAKGILIV